MPEYVEIDGEMVPTDIGFYRDFIFYIGTPRKDAPKKNDESYYAANAHTAWKHRAKWVSRFR